MFADGVVAAGNPISIVDEIWCNDGKDTEVNRSSVYCFGSGLRRSSGCEVFEDTEVCLVDSCQGVQSSPTVSRGNERRGRRGALTDRVVFIVQEEEQLVPDDGAAQLAAEAVIVKPRIFGDVSRSLGRQCDDIVNRVQIPILKILISLSMKTVGSTLNDRIELAAR